jgi:hypothetical protein
MIRCVRLWSGPDGKSHFEEGAIDLGSGPRGDVLSGKFPIASVGVVMSGWRPLIKGYFGVALVVGAVMSSAFLRGELSPLALMLSADPLPRSRERA